MIKLKQVKNRLIKIFILLVFILLNMTTKNVRANDKVEKFDDFEGAFLETSTRFIFIEDEAPKKVIVLQILVVVVRILLIWFTTRLINRQVEL